MVNPSLKSAPTRSDGNTIEIHANHVARLEKAVQHIAITIVVPCYNERESLATLFENLAEVETDLSEKYDVSIILVDDGSTDGTWPPLGEIAREREQWVAIQHKENRGIAAAIMTGIFAAKTDIVCSVDADCSYSLGQLETMIPMLTENVGMVTASPYHPDGKVVDVPGWRLWVSKICSRGYRLVLKNKLHTYTSCFRVYRREAVLPIELNNQGFAGVAELLIQLDERGNQIVECPAVLASRVTGVSKLKVIPAALSHVRLLFGASWRRLRGNRRQ